MRPVRAFATPELSELENEIAIPDESGDDRPDRLECAFHAKGRPFDVLLFFHVEIVPHTMAAPPPGARVGVAPEPQRPRFLSLCRLLI
jgi:hypothetical protein